MIKPATLLFIALSFFTLHNGYGDAISIHDAACHGYVNIMKQLLQNGADVHEQDEFGLVPLQYAYQSDNAIPIIGLLLSAGADINVRDGEKATILHVLCRPENHKDKHQHEFAMKLIRFFLVHGASVNAENSSGETPLQYVFKGSINENSSEVIRLLLAHGARISFKIKGNDTLLKFTKITHEKHLINMIKLLLIFKDKQPESSGYIEFAGKRKSLAYWINKNKGWWELSAKKKQAYMKSIEYPKEEDLNYKSYKKYLQLQQRDKDFLTRINYLLDQ